MSSSIYELSLEGLDITSDILAKLKELRIDSVQQLAVQNPHELAMEIRDDDSGSVFTVDSASQLIANPRKLPESSYYGLTYDNLLVTRGIETRRHDSTAFIKQFQSTLLSTLFDCSSSEEILTDGYENARFCMSLKA